MTYEEEGLEGFKPWSEGPAALGPVMGEGHLEEGKEKDRKGWTHDTLSQDMSPGGLDS